MKISKDVMDSRTPVFFEGVKGEGEGEAPVPVIKSSQDLPKP